MYILYQNIGPDQWEPVGFFDTFPDAVCAMQEELRKKDGKAMMIKREGENNDGQTRPAENDP